MRRPVAITRVDPRDVRDEVVDLLWEHRHWPASTRRGCLRLWDWRYTSLGDGDPLAWVARAPDGRVIGHIAVFRRRFRLGRTEVRCALPGDVLVHRDWRSSGVGARLILLPRQLVHEGAFDLVLVVGNAITFRLCTRLGFRDLGTYHTYADVRRPGAWLGRRFRPAAALGPLADRVWAARRHLRQRAGRRRAGTLVVEPVEAAAALRLDRRHWSHPSDRLVASEGEPYLVARFLGDPFTRRAMFGLFDPATRRIEGHVAIEYRGASAVVCDCRVNAARLDEPTAIALVGDRLPASVETYAVPTRPGSALATELEAAGFVRRPHHDAAPRLHLLASWNARHPAAASLDRLEAWGLYTGAADA